MKIKHELSQAWLTPKDAAKYLGIKTTTLHAWRSNKRYAIPYTKIGTLVRYRQDDLDYWLQSRLVQPKRVSS